MYLPTASLSASARCRHQYQLLDLCRQWLRCHLDVKYLVPGQDLVARLTPAQQREMGVGGLQTQACILTDLTTEWPGVLIKVLHMHHRPFHLSQLGIPDCIVDRMMSCLRCGALCSKSPLQQAYSTIWDSITNEHLIIFVKLYLGVGTALPGRCIVSQML